MKSISKKIIFFGTEEFSAIALRALLENDFPVAAVVTKQDSRKGRGQKLTPPLVKTLAADHAIPVWQPERLSDISQNIRDLGEVAGVLVSYGKIVPQSIIDLFHPGIINVHPSLLPLYRGPSPIESAIANGDIQTGVSIMQLTAAMDAGPVYARQTYPLDGSETQPALYETLGTVGAAMLVDILPSIISGHLEATPQDDAHATYCHLLNKEDSWLHPEHCSAIEAERKIRAHLTFPKTRLSISDHPVIITAAHVSHEQKTPLDIRCQDGAYLSIDTLIAPSGKEMSSSAFLNGYMVG